MRFMLDTNICIYIIKKRPEAVLEKFKTLTIGDMCISSITFAEMTYGAEKSLHQKSNLGALEEFVAPLDIVPFDDDCARHYGSIRSYLEKKGTPIGALDMMIAAHARCLGSILVTNNVKEFSRVKNLKIENWV